MIGHNHPLGESCEIGCPRFVFVSYEPHQPGHDHPAGEIGGLGCPGFEHFR